MLMYTLEQRFAKWACNRIEDSDYGKKNHLLGWSSCWCWRVCKQAKLSHLEHRKPARIPWIADVLKTSHCLVRILVQWHNSPFFFENEEGGSLSGHVERIFVNKNWRGVYWQHLVSIARRYVPHSRSYTPCFALKIWLKIYKKYAKVCFNK